MCRASGAALASAALGVVNLTIGANFPAGGLRPGLLFGNTDNFDGTIRLTQTTGGTATQTFNQTVPPAGVELGTVFFDIKNAVAGDAFTMFIKKELVQPAGANLNANVLYGGMTFDALPVPEPGSALLICAGAMLLLPRRRSERL